jgi:nitrogen fixation protein FixH
MADKSLVLGYSFTWEGNPVDAAVSLTPAADGKMTAQIDFANGAYIMSGTATKKEKSKQ